MSGKGLQPLSGRLPLQFDDRRQFRSERRELPPDFAMEISGDLVGIGNCIVGYPDGDYPVTRPRKENYIYRAE